jgi:hypothetical protein
VVVIMGLAPMVVTGCGGSDSSGGSSSGSTSSTASDSPPAGSSNPPVSESPNTEPSKEFLGSGPNGSLAKIGKESGVAEREEASRVLEEFFTAGAAGDWKTQCSLLAASVKESIENAVSLTGGVGCAAALGAEAQGLPASVRANTMTGPIDAFRINQGINGFAFYHGTEGKDYVIPLIEQSGWKVVTLRSEEIPP